MDSDIYWQESSSLIYSLIVSLHCDGEPYGVKGNTHLGIGLYTRRCVTHVSLSLVMSLTTDSSCDSPVT